jgi:hypothetical protein
VTADPQRRLSVFSPRQGAWEHWPARRGYRLTAVFRFNAANSAAFDIEDRFTLFAWVYSDSTPEGSVITRMQDTPKGRGYGVLLNNGKVHVHLTSNYNDDAIRLETEETLSPKRWYHIAVTYTGSRMAEGVRSISTASRRTPRCCSTPSIARSETPAGVSPNG